jgi:hypothetical protein
MGVLHKFSTCSSLALVLNNSELYNNTKEGAYIPFALSKSETIKSTINSYLTTLKLINAFLSTIQYKCASLHQLINAWRNNYQCVSKLCEGVVQLSFLLDVLAHLMSERCSYIRKLCGRFFIFSEGYLHYFILKLVVKLRW